MSDEPFIEPPRPRPTAWRTDLSLSQIEAGLRGRSEHGFEEAAQAAALHGDDGERLLTVLAPAKGWRAIRIAAALGDLADSELGGRHLRTLIATSGPGTTDLRCAATLALAKRERVRASEVLAGLVLDRSSAVRDYAVLGLAAYGDDRAWAAVAGRLKQQLTRQRFYDSEPPSVAVSCVYLLRHLDHAVERAEVVRNTLQPRWDRLTDGERKWLGRYWPAVIRDTDRPLLIDPAPAHDWLLGLPIMSAVVPARPT